MFPEDFSILLNGVEMQYVVIGKGGRHDIIVDILGESDYGGFYDDKPSASKSYLGPISSIKPQENTFALIGFGALEYMASRAKLLSLIGQIYSSKANAIHPDSVIAKSTKLGWGNVIVAHTTLGVNVQIGNGCTIFSNTTIEHDSKIGNNVNIAPGVTISGYVEIGDNVFIGAGVSIIERIKIGNNAVIGAGSLVIRNVDADSINYGSPARFVRRNDLYISD
jgi:sugar O-acyltransferase (sialic acid O-acetyltransferase NeuD family)